LQSDHQLIAGSQTKILQMDKFSYKRVKTVSRTVHIDQYNEIQRKGNFLHTPIAGVHGTLVKMELGVWFIALTPYEANPKRHHWFGNIRYDSHPSELINSKFNYFVVDMSVYVTSCATRVVVTKKNQWPNARRLELQDLNDGDPFLYNTAGEIKVLKNLTMKNQIFEHNLHFIIDVSTIDTLDIYRRSTVTAVNHDRANRRDSENGKFKSRQCLQFNGGLKIDCPFVCNRECMQDHIRNCDPNWNSCKHFSKTTFNLHTTHRQAQRSKAHSNPKYYDMVKPRQGSSVQNLGNNRMKVPDNNQSSNYKSTTIQYKSEPSRPVGQKKSRSGKGISSIRKRPSKELNNNNLTTNDLRDKKTVQQLTMSLFKFE